MCTVCYAWLHFLYITESVWVEPGILGAIHSTKLSGNFGPKLNGSARSNRKSFEKTGPPFEVVLFSRSDRLEFWLNGSRPEFQVQLRRFQLYTENVVTRNKPCTGNRVASEWVKKISIRSWVELRFTTISYILGFNYSYWYEINLIRIMYTANSSVLYSKEKTVRILGTWHQNLVNVSGLRYSKKIEFQEELINFLKTWLP